MNTQQGFARTWIIIASFITLLIASVWLWMDFRNQNHYQVIDEQVTVATSTNETEGWKTYKNEKYGYEFSYPQNWFVEENESGFVTIVSDHLAARMKEKGEAYRGRVMTMMINFRWSVQELTQVPGVTFEEWMNKDPNPVSVISIDGHKAYLQNYLGGAEGRIVYIPMDDNTVYAVDLDATYVQQSDFAIQDEILKSIKFSHPPLFTAYNRSQTHSLEFTKNALTEGYPVSVYIQKNDMSEKTFINCENSQKGWLDDNFCTWTIPQNFPIGLYRVEVIVGKGRGEEDRYLEENYFTIQ